MNVKVDVLSVKSIEDAISKIKDYKDKLERLQTELPKALAEYGMERAQIYYDYAAYDIYLDGTGGGADVEVSVEPTPNGYSIVARGEKVAFIEFGAGIYFNGDGGSYLGERPPFIANIGEYGMGNGSKPTWFFTDEMGESHGTHGTPASNALYFTMRDVKDRITEIAREILSHD